MIFVVPLRVNEKHVKRIFRGVDLYVKIGNKHNERGFVTFI